MRLTRSTATSIQVALICLVFVGAVGIAGQTQTQSEATAVSLVPDKCPNVSPGQSISFDWNPLFDPAFPVTGLRDVGLTFSPVGGDGAGLRTGRGLAFRSAVLCEVDHRAWQWVLSCRGSIPGPPDSRGNDLPPDQCPRPWPRSIRSSKGQFPP